MKKIIILILIVLVFLLGISYAWFNFTEVGETQKIITGSLYLVLDDKTDVISLTNVYPLSVEEARARNDNVMTFSVSGKNTSNKTIYYEIFLKDGEQIENKERFIDKHLVFDLSEVDENNNETFLLEATSYEEINNTKIWIDTINANTNEEINRKYKLRMWLSDKILISDTDPEADYTAYSGTANDFKNHYASIKVGVFGDFQEKKLGTTYEVVKADYKESGAKLYEGETRDSLDGHGHQPIYYYTSGENTNVLFNNTCWQMVRTTDTGGVKMIYNGDMEEKQVFDSYETLTDNDIIYTNDTKYPYTYSSGKWTSGSVPNANSSIGTFTFSVKEDGYYIINYDISTRENSHFIYVYINGIEIRRDSGIKESAIRLGNLKSDDIVKVNYLKNVQVGQGRDNIIFEITKGIGTSSTIESCDTQRKNGIGLSGSTGALNLGDTNYYYANSYTYTNNEFILSSDATQAKWSDTTYLDLLGKYICENKGKSCTTLHYVQSYNSSRQAGTSKYTITSKRNYSEIGTSSFNNTGSQLTKIGYMYNDVYKTNVKSSMRESVLNSFMFNSSHYYGIVKWNSIINKYELENASTVSNISLTMHKYTIESTSIIGQTAKYIVGTSGNYAYYVYMTNAGTHDLEYFNTAYTYGESIEEVDGKYKINNPITIHKTEWFTNYTLLKNKYLCIGESNLCNKEDLRYVVATGNWYYDYFLVEKKWRFGSDVNYTDGIYTLTGTITDVKDWPHNYNNTITNTHYTCFNEEESNRCTGEIYYVFNADSINIEYIKLQDGKKYDDALYEMINYKGNNINKTDAYINKYDSAVKQMIDHWFEHSGLINKTNYLEDTIFCNDRSLLNNSLRNWAPDGVITNGYSIYFNSYNTNANTIGCVNQTDMFSISNSMAKLKYPIGLLTEKERSKMGNNYAKTGFVWWLSAPYGYYYESGLMMRSTAYNGNYSYERVYNPFGLRPVISLSSSVKIINGDGGYDTPYQVGLS